MTVGSAPSSATLARAVRRWMTILAIAMFVTAELMVTASSTWVFVRSEGRVFSAADAPAAPVAIVFGAAVSDQEPGSYLKGRLDTTLELFERGLIETAVVSGDAIPPGDEEVAVMRQYLQRSGIPAHQIIDDPRGFDTDATCRRARGTYRVHRALLVTQNFHASRAVALCRAWGIDAFGVVAACDCSQQSLLRNYFREMLLSRPAAFVYALGA